MGVFDATRNQVLISPVTNYYKGDAIRRQAKEDEQIMELRDLQIQQAEQEIEDAPSKKKQAEDLAKANLENINLQIESRIRDGEIKEMEVAASALTPLLTQYSTGAQKDEDAALDYFNENFDTVLQSMSEAEQKKYKEAAGPDHRFSHEEVNSIGLMVSQFASLQQSVPELSKLNPKDFTPESWQQYVDSGYDSRMLRKAATDNPSRNDVIVPVLEKVRAHGKASLTDGEKEIYEDVVTRMSVEEKLMAALLGVDVADLGGDEPAPETPQAESAPATKEDVIAAAVMTFSAATDVEQRDSAIEEFVAQAKEAGYDVSKEEIERALLATFFSATPTHPIEGRQR